MSTKHREILLSRERKKKENPPKRKSHCTIARPGAFFRSLNADDVGQTKRSPRQGWAKSDPAIADLGAFRIGRGDEGGGEVDAFPRGSRLFRGHKHAKLDDESSMSRFSRLSTSSSAYLSPTKRNRGEEKEEKVGEGMGRLWCDERGLGWAKGWCISAWTGNYERWPLNVAVINTRLSMIIGGKR